MFRFINTIMEKKFLKTLFSKKTKLASKLQELDTDIIKKAKLKVEIEESLFSVEKEIFSSGLKNLVVTLADVKASIDGIIKPSEVDSVIEVLSKKSEPVTTFSKVIDPDSVIDCWTCSKEGRMNICYSDDANAPAMCPIDTVAMCDGIRIHAAFIKRGLK